MRILLALSILITGFAVAGPVKVVTSTTDLAWAIKRIGGEKVDVQALLKGTENPHYVDAVPEFIRLASNAQLVCVVGLDLEVGWMPKVLSRSMNAQVQPGGKGYCEAGKGIQVLDKPLGQVDRSMGDIHPAGNPHFWFSPKHFAQAGAKMTEFLITVDPTNTAAYQEGLKQFTRQMDELHARNEKKLRSALAGVTGAVFVEYHKEFTYFGEAYGLKSLGSIEEKPGISPSAGRLAEIAMAAKTSGVKFALAADTAPKKTLERFAELSGLPVVTVPLSVQPKGDVKDYDALQDRLVDSIVKAIPKSAGAKSEPAT